MKTVLSAILCFFVLNGTNFIAATAQDTEIYYDDWCGAPVPVAEYRIVMDEYTVSIPKADQFLVNGVLEYESSGLGDWEFEYNGVLVHSFSDGLLVQTFAQNCIDSYFSRIYVINVEGDVIASNQVWSANWVSGFYFEHDALTYWSEWFCHDANQEVSEHSYVMTLKPGADRFVRERRSLDENCSEEAVGAIKSSLIEFAMLTPENPVYDIRQR